MVWKLLFALGILAVVLGCLYRSVFLPGGFVFKLYVVQKRRRYLRKMAAISEKNPFPEGVTEIRHTRYTEFHPTEATGKLPIIVDIHGGGLVVGHREFNRIQDGELAKLGAHVYSIDYPLVPECTVFEQLAQVSTVVDGIWEKLKESGEAERGVFLLGDSAGGLLAFYTAALQANASLAKQFDLDATKAPILGVGYSCGMFYSTGPDMIGRILKRHVWGGDCESRVGEYSNPEKVLSETTMPPMLLVTSEGDSLRRYTDRLMAYLKKNGPKVEFYDYPGKELRHAFTVFMPKCEASGDVREKFFAFLNKIR